MQINTNPGLFSPVVLFFGPNTLLPVMETPFSVPHHIQKRPKKRSSIRLDNSNIYMKDISASVMWPLCYAPAREMKHFSHFWSFFFYWLAASSTRKHVVSRFCLLMTVVWRNCCLARLTPSHTPSGVNIPLF